LVRQSPAQSIGYGLAGYGHRRRFIAEIVQTGFRRGIPIPNKNVSAASDTLPLLVLIPESFF